MQGVRGSSAIIFVSNYYEADNLYLLTVLVVGKEHKSVKPNYHNGNYEKELTTFLFELKLEHSANRIQSRSKFGRCQIREVRHAVT